MSGDDIVFDDVTYREPAKLCRPDRDRRFTCLAYEVPGPLDLPIFLDHRTADAIERHALSDTSVELGGVLIGKECLDAETGDPFVWVTNWLEAKHFANTQASFTYTHDSWEEMTRDRDKRYPDLDIVGWYHTHPNFGIFLSHHDLFIHRNFFGQPLQIAYVVDPINQSRGFFRWRDGSMEQVGGFWLVGERGDRLALARQVNELENLGTPEGTVGGAFSPRLEAELIRMLNRQSATYVSSPTEPAQAAVIFTMLGSMLGILGVGLVFWLYQIGSRLQEQGETLSALSRAVQESSDKQRVVLDLFANQAKGEKPTGLTERYIETLKTCDDLTSRLDLQSSISRTLASRAKDLETQLGQSASSLDAAKRELEGYGKDIKEAPKLREQLAKLEETARAQKTLLDSQAMVVDSVEGKHVSELLEHLTQTRYAAYLGWALSGILLMVAIGMSYFHQTHARGEADSALPHRIS